MIGIVSLLVLTLTACGGETDMEGVVDDDLAFSSIEQAISTTKVSVIYDGTRMKIRMWDGRIACEEKVSIGAGELNYLKCSDTDIGCNFKKLRNGAAVADCATYGAVKVWGRATCAYLTGHNQFLCDVVMH